MYKTLLEWGPLVGFFIAYGWKGLEAATATLIVLTLLAVPVVWKLERKAPLMMLVTAAIVAVFGGLTLALHDETFIKLKPTVVNLLFAAVLLGGAACGKPLIKHVLGGAMAMPDAAWRTLSIRWGLFFAMLAGLNEIVWRSVSTDHWVQFKVFGLIGLTFVFALSQIPFMQRHGTEK